MAKTPSWKRYLSTIPDEETPRRERERAAGEKLSAARSAIEEEQGFAMSDSAYASMFDQYMTTGEFVVPESPNFQNVEGESLGTVSSPAPVLPDNTPRAVRELGQVGDAAQGSLQRLVAGGLEQTARMDAPQAQLLNRQVTMWESLARGDLQTAYEAAVLPLSSLNGKSAGRLRADAAENQKSAQALKESYNDESWGARQIAHGVVDATSSASSWVSLVGGPLGALAMGDAYAQAHFEAKQRGLDDTQAEIYAASQSAPEAISFIPAGKLFEKIPGIGPYLKKRASEYAEKRIKEMAGETTERLTTPAVAAAIDLTKTVMGESAEEGITSALQDTALIALAGQEKYKELQQVAAEQAPKDLGEFLTNIGESARAGAFMAGPGGIPSAMGAQSRAEADMQDRDARTEQAILEKATERTNQAPVLPSPQPTAVSSTPVAEQPEVVPDVPATPEVEQDDPAVHKSDIAKINHWKRQTGMSDDMFAEHVSVLTGKTDTKSLTPEERQAVIADLSGKPYEAPAPKKPKPEPAAVDPAVAPVQSELNEIEKLLLNQDSKATPAPAQKAWDVKSPEYRAIVKQVSSSLTRANTQQDVDVANLMRQGKLVVAPSAESVGLDPAQTGAASYNTDTGEMFIFADKMDPDAPVRVETLAAAIHESTHAGQFNERDARSSTLKFMMSPETYGKANDKVKAAAKAGNAIARQAVEDAMIAAGMDPNTGNIDPKQYDSVLEGLEILPYLGTAVTRARGKPLGRVGGAWADVQSGLRAFARKTFGPNTEIDFNELMSATQKIAGEIVKTDVKPAAKPANKSEVLNMVAGKKATGFADAKERNRIYQGFVDRKDRFEFSDSNSAITNDPETMTEYTSGTPMYLGEVLGHESLYEQYPEALTIMVQYNPSLQQGEASFDAAANLIEVGPQGDNDRRLRSTLLHEVQHWIQEKEGFIKGFNDDVLVDPDVRASKMEATNFINHVISKLDLPAAIDQLPEDLRAQWEEEGVQTADPMIQAEMFLAGVYGNAHPNGHVRNRARRYAVLNERRMAADSAYKEQMDAAWDAYIRDYGETEARNTQRRANVPQEQMDNALDPNPESEMRYANFNVPVERTQDSLKLLEDKNVKPKKSGNEADNFGAKKGLPFNETEFRPEVMSWAQQMWGELEAPNGRPIWQNFVEWFGSSKMVNEDGTPRMLFHGTNAEVDFEEFHKNYDWEIGTHIGTSFQASDPRFVGSIYTSSENGMANTARMKRAGPSSRVIPLYARLENPLRVVDSFGSGPTDIVLSVAKALGVDYSNLPDTWDKELNPLMSLFQWMQSPAYTQHTGSFDTMYREAWNKIAAALEKMGYDSLEYQNIAEGFKFFTEDGKQDGTYAPGKSPNPSHINYYPYASDFPEYSYVILDPAQVKSVNNTGDYDGRTARLLNQSARRQTVYHGTPNTFTNKDEKNPFGKFDLSFMSRGEGQQAVGYGFYFSGDWNVSDSSYRQRLVNVDSDGWSTIEEAADHIYTEAVNLDGELTGEGWNKYKDKIAAWVEESKANLEKFADVEALRTQARQFADAAMKGNEGASRENLLRDFMNRAKMEQLRLHVNVRTGMDRLAIMENTTPEQILEIRQKSFQTHAHNDGELFYVEIPADEDLAYWDGTFNEQPENVRVILDNLLSDLPDVAEVQNLKDGKFRDLYHHLANIEGNLNGVNGEAALSAKLNSYGIPGHRFKPIHMQFGGKSKNPPYYNYVIYHPEAAKIVGRDAREKGQTRQEMLDWAATIADRNTAKARAWESEARARLEGQKESDYGRILYMASRKGTAQRKQKALPVWMRSLFGSSGATTREIREITEHAVSSPALTRMLAENYEGKYRAAVTKEAARLKISEAELDKRITNAVDGINPKTSTYDANLAAFKVAVKPFGEAGRVLVDMREMVDNISLDMLRDRAARAANGEAMSPAEKKQYAAIMANLGRYGHRQYAAHLRDAGFGEAVWDSYNKAKNKDPLTDADKANALRVTKALRVLVDQVMIPDDGKLATASQDRIDSLYTTWIGRQNVDALTYDEKREELAAIRDVVNGDSNAMQNQAERIAEEILGLHGNDVGMIANYYRGGKMDLGILKKRQKLPPEIRELMGEIKDPAMRLLITASKQAEFVARSKMLMEISRVRDPYHVQPPGPSGRGSVKGMMELKGDTYGAMNGMWVSPELHNLVRDNIEMLASFEDAVAMAAARPAVLTNKALVWALNKWSGLAANTKMLQIIGNPTNFLFNLFGGPRMMLVNGNINPKHFGNAFVTASELIAYARNPAKAGERARRVTGAGVVDSAFIGEISSDQYRTLMNNVQKMVGTEPSFKDVRSFLRKSGMSIKETYAMMDVMFKIANFYQQADAVLPEFYKAEGIKKTQQEIDREAADIVNRTNITYKRAATIVKAFERGGITQFGTYLYEVFRTEVQNFGQGLEELARANSATTPEGRRLMTMQATRRVGGQLLAWALTAAVSRALAEITFGDDEEDKYLRYLLPEFARGKDFVVAGKDKSGNNVMVEFSRLDPVGPATDIMRRMLNLELTPKALADEVFGLYIAPRIAGRIATAVTQTFIEQKNIPAPIVETVWPAAYEHVLRVGARVGVEEDTTRAWTRLIETGLPGGLNTLRESNPKIVNEDGTPSAIANLTRAMGVSYVAPEPTKQMGFAASSYDDTVKNERRKVAGLARSYSEITDRDVMGKLVEARAEEFNAFKDAQNIYRGMKALGMSDSEIEDSWKSARVSKDLARQLRSGEFKSQIVSQKSFKGHRDTAIRRATTEAEREEIRQKWDSAWEIVKGVASDD